MNNFWKAAVLILLLAGYSALAQASKPTVNDLAWLAGCWESNVNGREINEQWMKPSGGVMLGMGARWRMGACVNTNSRKFVRTKTRDLLRRETFKSAGGIVQAR
jgi:hypothetical protein